MYAPVSDKNISRLEETHSQTLEWEWKIYSIHMNGPWLKFMGINIGKYLIHRAFALCLEEKRFKCPSHRAHIRSFQQFAPEILASQKGKHRFQNNSNFLSKKPSRWRSDEISENLGWIYFQGRLLDSFQARS